MAEGLNTAGVELGAPGIAAGISFLSLHSDVPDASGSNESTAGRVDVTATAAGGVVTVGSTSFTGGEANGDVVAVGYWSAGTAGTFYGYNLVDGDQSFNAAGEYTVDSVTITGSSA